MLDYVSFETPEYLIVANGEREAIVGEGTVQVQLESGCTFLLFNVKHVPTSKKRLMSVGKAYSDGININILGIDCYITDSQGNMLGHAEHIFPYQWVVDLSIKREECLIQCRTLDLWRVLHFTGARQPNRCLASEIGTSFSKKHGKDEKRGNGNRDEPSQH